MKDYYNMTDDEINKEVTEIQHGLENWLYHEDNKVFTMDHFGIIETISVFDYCNSWEYAGPIIVESRIAIRPAGKLVGKFKPEHTWLAKKQLVFCRNDNPLRAAMIVFLMIKGDK